MPAKSKSRPSRKGRQIGVGRRVTFRVANRTIRAEVVENRGFIGWRGRELLRVRTLDEPDDARRTFEIPADDVTVVN